MIIIYIIMAGLALSGLVYFLSRVQMRAWLHEADHFLGKQLTNYINSKKENKDEKQKE
jgi:hypothetical protein